MAMVRLDTPNPRDDPASDVIYSARPQKSPKTIATIPKTPGSFKRELTRRPRPLPLNLVNQIFPLTSCSIRTSPMMDTISDVPPITDNGDDEGEYTRAIRTLAVQLTSPGLPPHVGMSALQTLRASKQIEAEQRYLIRQAYKSKARRRSRRLKKLIRVFSIRQAIKSETDEKPLNKSQLSENILEDMT
ncbi:hypothetical protein NADFUDRAFT_41402 [Nadsonia fulvescens var. elongata DSM 6958]|uniref:Uncharacterized protein n=1 Tax=Nadsonia fulvescens var. elongata DSM 6958 TaxID=857566 RepID=A0A1E3PN80_9ASCO|nr:hypothetical protein NADFUDRAFT_41402 [Nadsonia fulvescens var. elongata DSM 6958]